MVKVRVEINKNVIKITLSGHTNYAKKGNDIVCAGISGVIQLMGIYFFNILHEEGNFSFKDGYGYVEVINSEHNMKLVEAFTEYIKLISNSYPNSVDIEIQQKH